VLVKLSIFIWHWEVGRGTCECQNWPIIGWISTNRCFWS